MVLLGRSENHHENMFSDEDDRPGGATGEVRENHHVNMFSDEEDRHGGAAGEVRGNDHENIGDLILY